MQSKPVSFVLALVIDITDIYTFKPLSVTMRLWLTNVTG